MSVELHPGGMLGFPRPLTQLVKRSLTVVNHNDEPVIFKVKTTAPKQYCVRPNSGRVEPGQKVEVQVLLQPMREDPPPGAKCRDKFLVQSAIIPDPTETRLPEIWQAVEREGKEGVHEQKIRCQYLPPVDEMPSQHEPAPEHTESSIITNGNQHDEDARYNTVRTSPTNGSIVASTRGYDAPPSPVSAENNIPMKKSMSFEQAPDSTPARSAIAPTVDEMKSKLADYVKEIERLKEQLKDRKVVSAAGEKVAHVQQAVIGADAPIDGVKMEVVAALMFATFLFTWLFF
ncbi:VAMP-associated protein [Atractiella rhizophila]|nr:VAMP-associated protein [Atractiella rhizophila]